MKRRNILNDPNFENGFMLKGLNSIKDGHKPIYEFRFNGKNPSWYLCQWNSKYNLKNGQCANSDGFHSIFDISKKITVQNSKLLFRLNASQEYDAPRKPNDGWPHILIEQDINGQHKLSGMKRFELSGSFKLTDFRDCMNNQNKNHHTAQFVWVVVLKNTNPNSLDYNRFMWVVICLIDTRYEYAPLFCQQDKALPNGEFIYSFCGKDFLPKPLTLNDEVNVKFDIFPHLDNMLAAANRADFLVNSQKEDFELVSMNMGFEVTGTYDIEVEAKNLAIYID